MPQPLKADRPVEKSISIPTSIHTKVELQLFSSLEGRVPHGAWSRLVTNLLQQYLDNLSKGGKP